MLSMRAAIQAATPDDVTKHRPHNIAATYCPGVYFMSDEIDFYVDISEWKEQRVQAECLFSSQGHTEAYTRKRLEIGAGRMGRTLKESMRGVRARSARSSAADNRAGISLATGLGAPN